MKISDMTRQDMINALRTNVRVTRGWAKGMTGIFLGYNDMYDTAHVGFIDADGNYSGEKTTVAASEVETIESNPRHKDNRPNEHAVFVPDLVREDGSVWSHKTGNVYRNGKGSAVPRAFLTGARESDYGTWI